MTAPRLTGDDRIRALLRSEVDKQRAKAVTSMRPRDEPVEVWARRRLGVAMWSKQREFTESVRVNPRTAVYSCHDAGKSFGAAVLCCHHIDTHPEGQARIITTAPSTMQVRGVLWNEINALYAKAESRGDPLPGEVNQTEWWIDRYQAGVGRKPNDYNAELFAGFHARFPLVVLDEADGLAVEVWEGIEALLTNRLARLFAIGNPLDAQSRFARIREEQGKLAPEDRMYNVVSIPYDSTPNFTGEDVPEFVRDVLLSREWVEDKRRSWGDYARALKEPAYQPLENPFWWGRILAEYPPDDARSIVTSSMIARSLVIDEPVPTRGVRQIGVDLAGSLHGDETVVRERVGNTSLRRWTIRTDDDDRIEDFVVACAREAEASIIVMDATSLGFGFTGRVRKRLKGVGVSGVNFSAASTKRNPDGSRKYANLRAELWWEQGREALRTGGVNLAHAEKQDTLIADLTSARHDPEALSSRRIIQVEDKDEIRKRLGRSPDDGDAFLLSFFTPNGVGTGRVSHARGRLPTGAAAAGGGVRSLLGRGGR